MINTKINLLLLPLLIAVLLSTAGKLKIGASIDNIFYTILIPIHTPITFLHQNISNQVSLIKSLPHIRQQLKDLVSQNSYLLSENELLKQSLSDTKATIKQNTNFKSVLPVRLAGSIGNNSVSSTFPLDQVKKGQPLILGKILLGTVADIKGSIINITPLDSDRFGTLAVHTSSGQKGQYRYTGNTSQIIDIPSLSPIVYGDYVFSEPTELIPNNLVIGKIVKVISGQQEPLQKAQIKLETTLRDTNENLVIILIP